MCKLSQGIDNIWDSFQQNVQIVTSGDLQYLIFISIKCCRLRECTFSTSPQPCRRFSISCRSRPFHNLTQTCEIKASNRNVCNPESKSRACAHVQYCYFSCWHCLFITTMSSQSFQKEKMRKRNKIHPKVSKSFMLLCMYSYCWIPTLEYCPISKPPWWLLKGLHHHSVCVISFSF